MYVLSLLHGALLLTRTYLSRCRLPSQAWSDNMTKAGEPKILSNKGEDYTCITFIPDLDKFQMEALDKDIVALFTRRAYDIVASSKGVKVFLNGKRLPVSDLVIVI